MRVPFSGKCSRIVRLHRSTGCAATKTAAIVNYALAPEMLAPVVDYLKTEPFSLCIDGSSDTGTENLCPVSECQQGFGICVLCLTAVRRAYLTK